MVEIGAGGGSVAHIDKLQRIKVGPESAGSEPGPACYGRGGKRPAVTDADVCLGRVFARTFAGGAFSLDADAAGTALRGEIARPLNMELESAAFGISEVVDENMAAAARTHAAEFGLDLASRDMVAFGGAAPLHAARLGEKLGVNRIVVPAGAGVGSAIGFLLAPVAYEVVRSRHQDLSDLQVGLVNGLMEEMKAEALDVVLKGVGPDKAATDLLESRHAYMRYVGQGHEISVRLPVENYTGRHGGIFRDCFEAAYRRLYGRTIEGVEIEVLSWTLTISSAEDHETVTQRDSTAPRELPPVSGSQMLFDPAVAGRVEVPVYLRNDLQPGTRLNGPALITEDQTTTVVTSNYHAMIDIHFNIVLTRKSGEQEAFHGQS
jgi:N-methylhydantoinase A